MLHEAQDFLAADDGESALTILRVLGEEVIETYPEFEYAETDVAEFIEDMGGPLAKALLACNLPPARRREWEDRLTRWAEHVEDYGIYEPLDAAIAALRGWDAEPEEDEEGFAADGSTELAAVLTDARLNILERRGHTEEFLALAEWLREAGCLEGHKHRLGVWLSDLAAGLGRNKLALQARVVAFEARPSLEDY